MQEAIAGPGKRPRSERLRAVIEMICGIPEWRTTKQLSRFLGASEETLRSRPLPAILDTQRRQAGPPFTPRPPATATKRIVCPASPDRGSA